MHNYRGRGLPRTGRVCSAATVMACSVVMTAAALPAWAQQQNVAGTLMLEPITIEGNSLYYMKSTEETGGYAARAATVGTKTPSTLRDIPQSVSVVTREVIEDRNYTTLDEMAQHTPGLRVLNNDMGRSSVYARGYEYSESKINGMPAPMASVYGSLPNLVAFDRVEVLRGPSGLFNSSSTMGGIVNLVLKRPTDTFQGYVEGRYGSWNQYFTALDLSGPLRADGAVRGRLVAAKKGSDGIPDGNEVGSDTLYGALEFDLSPDTLLSLGLLRQTRDIAPDNGMPTDEFGNLVYGFSDDTFFGADWNHFDSESYDVVASLSHDFDNGGHTDVSARYRDHEGSMNYIFGGSALVDGKATVAGLGREFEQTSLSLDASYSQPFETFGNVSEFVVGVDYKNYETDTYGSRYKDGQRLSADEFRAYPYVDIIHSNPSATHSELRSYGLYSKLTFRPIQSLALIGGARIGGYAVDYGTQSRHDSLQVTPYAGVVFDVYDHVSLYASYSTVFEPQEAVGLDGELLKPREGEQFEVGVKGSYFAGALNARLSLFHLQDKNTGVPAAVGSNQQIPIGVREVQGVEVEVTGSPTPNLDITFGYTYLDTDVKIGTPRNEGIFMLMPNHRANLWARYSFTRGRWEGLRLGAGVTAVGDFASIQGIKAPSYVVANAMLGYQFTKHLSGQLNVNNLFDEEYYSRVGSFGTFNMRGEPANFMASVRYNF